jgi:DNA polymerase-3 subunit gamma/tau
MTSLHTKYRPTTFDQVLGQSVVTASLRHVVKEGRAKTFLFTGPSGTGKTTLARILANEFSNRLATAANIEEINAADSSGADDMRGVVARSLYRAVGASPIKAIIVDEVHRLSAAAWNVLLKPTEEPPKHVYWLLATTEPGRIPKTLLTRCLRYDLKPVSEELIYGLLEEVCGAEGMDVDGAILEAIAENAGGSPRQGLAYLEACAACKTASEALQAMRSAGQSREAVDLARWLVNGSKGGWAEAIKLVKALEGMDAESIRITIVQYLSSVLVNTKDAKRARVLLGILECFDTQYLASDRMAPLLRSLGLATVVDL